MKHLSFIFCVSSFAIAASYLSLSAFAEQSRVEMPYKAGTVFECVNERACLKHIFLNEVVKDYGLDEEREGFRLNRWNQGIRFGVFGVPREEKDLIRAYGQDVLKTIHIIDPYFPKPLTLSTQVKEMNFAVALGRDLKHSIEEHKKDWLTFFSSDFISLIKDDQSDYPKSILTMENNEYLHGAILIDLDDNPTCFTGLLMHALGANEMKASTFGLKDYSDCDMNMLSGLILTILYSEAMPAGASVHEMEAGFDAFYEQLETVSQMQKIKPAEFLQKQADQILQNRSLD